MPESQRIVLAKSDNERILDLATSVIGLAVLTYMLHPEPFERVFNYVRAFAHGWVHRVSIWEARQAIRSLPETDDE